MRFSCLVWSKTCISIKTSSLNVSSITLQSLYTWYLPESKNNLIFFPFFGFGIKIPVCYFLTEDALFNFGIITQFRRQRAFFPDTYSLKNELPEKAFQTQFTSFKLVEVMACFLKKLKN